MSMPVIEIYKTDGSAKVSTWTPGVVKAGKVTDDEHSCHVHVWNNKGGQSDVSDMIECTVAAFDVNGKLDEEIAKQNWIELNLNDQKDDEGTEKKFVGLGAAGPQPIWALSKYNGTNVEAVDPKASGFGNTPTTDHVISGKANDGKPETEKSKANYADCYFRLKVDQSATPGSTGFKIRFQGYYV